MKAQIPQGLTGSPNYFWLLNNLMTLIICESLREIGEMACVTPAWSSHGQTLKWQYMAIDGNILVNMRGRLQTKSIMVFFIVANSALSEKVLFCSFLCDRHNNL